MVANFIGCRSAFGRPPLSVKFNVMPQKIRDFTIAYCSQQYWSTVADCRLFHEYLTEFLLIGFVSYTCRRDCMVVEC